MKTLNQKISETQRLAHERLVLAKNRSKKYYDEKMNVQNYEVEEMVYLYNNSKDGKLNKEYTGPYKVTQVFNDYNVEIELDWGKFKIVHMNRLRPQCHRVHRKQN